MPSTADSQPWEEGLKLVSFCPVCDTRYNSMEAKLLGEQEETRLLHVQCRKCHHSIIALVLVNQVGASSVGLLTDLSYEDVMLAKASRAVSIDDVIAVHRLFDRSGWEERLGVRHTRRMSHARRKRPRKAEAKQEGPLQKSSFAPDSP